MSQSRIFIATDAHAAWSSTARELGITAEQLITSVGRFLLIDPGGPVSSAIRENAAAILAEPLAPFAIMVDRPLFTGDPDPDAEQMFAEDVREWDDEDDEDDVDPDAYRLEDDFPERLL